MSIGVYSFWHSVIIGYYVRKNINAGRDLNTAQEREKWWAENKPDEEDLWDDDDEEEDDEDEEGAEDDDE